MGEYGVSLADNLSVGKRAHKADRQRNCGDPSQIWSLELRLPAYALHRTDLAERLSTTARRDRRTSVTVWRIKDSIAAKRYTARSNPRNRQARAVGGPPI